jgi:hypothetical protein
VLTYQGTGNGGSPIIIDSGNETQCNVIIDENVPSGFYNVSLTNIQSVFGFKMAPKTFSPGSRISVAPGKYGTLKVTYGVVK